MVATDTIVGIVGAVVLVAVMAGVFVYEYNNAPDVADDDVAKAEHFEEDYPGLVAAQDIDGDGIANYLDDDFDGDGINNTDDMDVMVAVPVSGNVAQATPASATPYTQTFMVYNGTEHISGVLTYSRTGGATPSLEAVLTGPDGFSISATQTTTGNTATLTFPMSDAMTPGEYTLTVRHVPLGGPVTLAPQAAVAGSMQVHYASLGEPHTH